MGSVISLFRNEEVQIDARHHCLGLYSYQTADFGQRPAAGGISPILWGVDAVGRNTVPFTAPINLISVLPPRKTMKREYNLGRVLHKEELSLLLLFNPIFLA